MTGLWIGAVAGAVPGAILGAWLAPMCDCSDPDYLGWAVLGGLYLGLPAALLGAGIGALVQTDRWEDVSPDALRVTVRLGTGGLGVGLAVRF